jgi:hypothetical protein
MNFRETEQVLSKLALASSGRASMASWVLHADEPRSSELLLVERVDLVQDL